MMRRKILVSAYGCEPGKGSEQGVGWNWVLQLATIADLTVVTRSNNRQVIEKEIPYELNQKITFLYHDAPSFFKRLKRKEKGLYLYYLVWQLGAYRLAKQLFAGQHFDYVMHLTFGSIWMPTFMHRLPAPFIWGPIGGGEAVPFQLISHLPPRDRVLQYFRYGLKKTFRFNPLFWSINHRARIILARTSETAEAFPQRYLKKVRVALETGASNEWLKITPRRIEVDSSRKLKVIYTGRLVAIKNVDSAIRAVGQASRKGAAIHFTMIGDGPDRGRLESLAGREGIHDLVDFRGSCSQAEVLTFLRDSDIFLFPSLKEGGSWSLMEAMSSGLPTICVNASGMAVITDDNSAIRVEAISQEQMIEDFASALVELAQSPERRKYLGENARRRIEEEFCWQSKGDFMAALFDELEQDSSGTCG